MQETPHWAPICNNWPWPAETGHRRQREPTDRSGGRGPRLRAERLLVDDIAVFSDGFRRSTASYALAVTPIGGFPVRFRSPAWARHRGSTVLSVPLQYSGWVQPVPSDSHGYTPMGRVNGRNRGPPPAGLSKTQWLLMLLAAALAIASCNARACDTSFWDALSRWLLLSGMSGCGSHGGTASLSLEHIHSPCKRRVAIQFAIHYSP